MGRFADHRQVLLKGVDIADQPRLDVVNTPGQLSSPKWISPMASGRLAAKMAGKDDLVSQRMPNRADRRGAVFSAVRVARRRGVALKPEAMPWKV